MRGGSGYNNKKFNKGRSKIESEEFTQTSFISSRKDKIGQFAKPKPDNVKNDANKKILLTKSHQQNFLNIEKDNILKENAENEVGLEIRWNRETLGSVASRLEAWQLQLRNDYIEYCK